MSAAATGLRRSLWRLAGLLAVLTPLAWLAAPRLAQALLPALRAELQWLDNTYRIEHLVVDTTRTEPSLHLTVTQVRCIVFSHAAVQCGDPRGRAEARTLVGHLALPLALLPALLWAWPAAGAFSLWRRTLMLPVASLMVWALDTPLLLWASLWGLHARAFTPDAWWPLLAWAQFLDGGGRHLLVLIAAAGVLALDAGWPQRRAPAAGARLNG